MYAYIKLPSFIPLIRQLSNPEIAAFFIKETAYWGSDVEVGYLEEYFDSPDQNFRKAAFEGMGLRRFVAAEEKMKACFYNQSESIKRVILESILSIRSGKSATFIKKRCLIPLPPDLPNVPHCIVFGIMAMREKSCLWR